MRIMYHALRGLDTAAPADIPLLCQTYEQSTLPLYMVAARRRMFIYETSPSTATTKQTAAGTTGSDGSNPADNESFDWQDDPD